MVKEERKSLSGQTASLDHRLSADANCFLYNAFDAMLIRLREGLKPSHWYGPCDNS